MTLSRTNTVLAILLVIVVLMTALSGIDYSQPNFEVLPDMKYTPAWTAFAANPNFPNGRTLQAPVLGAIARGEMPLYYVATKEDAIRAGEELINPYDVSELEADTTTKEEEEEEEEELAEQPAEATDESSIADDTDSPSATVRTETTGIADKTAVQNEMSEEAKREVAARERLQASVQRGGGVFRIFCISCHGAKGAGDGLVTQHGFPPPPSMLTGKSLQMKDGQLFHILTYGQGSMAPFAAQLSRDQRWDVINYVRDLQSKAPPAVATPPTSTAEPEVQARPETGEEPPKPAGRPEPDTPEKSADSTQETSEEETDARPGKETAAAPPNALRDPPSNDTKPSRSSDTGKSKDDIEPSGESEI